MQILTQQMDNYIANSSWIRKMFETGIEMKQQFGAENVYDFSLGNPDLPPPAEVAEALSELASKAREPLAFGYVPNAGLPGVREKLATLVSREQKVGLKSDHVIVTCGAAGALNAFFRAVLDAGDEVICSAPYFVEYGFYAGNFGGVLRPVASLQPGFKLDLKGIEQAITPKTRAVIVNSPNNPTGCVSSAQELTELAQILKRHSQSGNRPIFLVSDEPYRFLTYDNAEVPSILPLYEFSVVAGSFSKSLSLAGERIGYIAVNPDMGGALQLVNGLVLANRILGFVNAPVIGQQILDRVIEHGVDVGLYDERRQAMAKVLSDAGYDFVMPEGAFYFFPKAPGNGDDKAFVRLLQEQNILAVPGSGFGYPGHFRVTFCMDKRIILNAAEGFRKAMEQAT